MDLICPICQKRLTIDNRYSGAVVQCPLCNARLQAPVLLSSPAATMSAPTSSRPDPPVSAIASTGPARFDVPSPAEVDNPAPVASAPSDCSAAVQVAGEHPRSFSLSLQSEVLEWVAPCCLGGIGVLSFFPWYLERDPISLDPIPRNLWQLAFTAEGQAIYTFYAVVLLFATMPLAALILCVEKRWLPLPPPMRPLWKWRMVLVGGAIALTFVSFVGDYVACQFKTLGNPSSVAMKLAFRAQLAALVSCALQVWLEHRAAEKLPLPRFEVRW